MCKKNTTQRLQAHERQSKPREVSPSGQHLALTCSPIIKIWTWCNCAVFRNDSNLFTPPLLYPYKRVHSDFGPHCSATILANYTTKLPALRKRSCTHAFLANQESTGSNHRISPRHVEQAGLEAFIYPFFAVWRLSSKSRAPWQHT